MGRDAARRLRGDVNQRVAAARRAVRILAASAAPQVGRNVGRRHCGRRGNLVFQRPLLDCSINLAEVVDARILLRGGAGLDEVGNRDRCQEADDGHHDHDFD